MTVGTSGVEKADLRPTATDDQGLPEPLTGRAAKDAIAAWNKLRGCTGLAAKP